MTTAAGQYKFFKMHKTEQADIREYDMGTKAFDKSLSSDVHEIRGKFANCGKHNTTMSFQWSPAIIDIYSAATFYFDIVAPVDLGQGTLLLDVYVPNLPGICIFTLERPGTCDEIKHAVLSSLTCPIKANDEMKGQTPINDLRSIPTGSYIFVMKIVNEKSQEFLCVNGTFHFITKPSQP